MEALLIGELVNSDGCLRVNAGESDTSYLIVWPPGLRPDAEKDVIQILNQAGKTVLRVGDEVRISGGEVSFSAAEQVAPADCPGPYWIVGDGAA